MKSINDIRKIKRLKGHKKRIVFVKYFKNPFTLQEYLISGDREENVRAWEILDENNYLSLCVIKTNYGRLLMQQSIYNCLIYFIENRSYIITTTVTNNYSRLYDLENGALIKDISLTYYNYTFYLIRYKEYIIDCCKNFVMIYNPINEDIYSKIENSYTKGDNRSCCIIYNKNNNDYLYISNSNGYVIEYCLNTKTVMYNFDINKDLYHIIFWDLNNLVIAEYNSEYV
jgi:WD40 repeat protein